ncbi:hypothetical protein LZ30DRAFT_777066 [Colletotrichum cereale]|nr:hypothetical protein LZ30DRAFT_777066 [Colletotrichum cereale]
MDYDSHTKIVRQGARAYYMHSGLRKWTNEVGRNILSRIKAAMKPGCSKPLANESVLPLTRANWQTTALDMTMTPFSSRERAKEQWHNLLEPVGIKTVKFWTKGEGVGSLIECELA